MVIRETVLEFMRNLSIYQCLLGFRYPDVPLVDPLSSVSRERGALDPTVDKLLFQNCECRRRSSRRRCDGVNGLWNQVVVGQGKGE